MFANESSKRKTTCSLRLIQQENNKIEKERIKRRTHLPNKWCSLIGLWSKKPLRRRNQIALQEAQRRKDREEK